MGSPASNYTTSWQERTMRPSSKLCSQLFKHGASRRHQLNAGFWGKKRPKNIKKILTEKKYELVMRKVYRL
ncbi:hypothetical protein BT96DRAFT_913376, partial [Gymnopus androsaceus JB14]